MSAPQHCIGHISTPYGDAAILVGRYPSGGAIAIQLVDDEDPSEPMATFSTNLVPYGASVAEDEFCVKTWSENEVLVAPMLATGLFEDTGRRVPSGHVVAPVWRIKDPANVPPVPGRRSGSDRTAALESVCCSLPHRRSRPCARSRTPFITPSGVHPAGCPPACTRRDS